MNIQLLSDVHLETHPNFLPTCSADADVLVLAGDIGSYQGNKEGNKLINERKENK